jgi:hypothetical protein
MTDVLTMKRAVGMPRGFLPLVISSVTLTSAVAATPEPALEAVTAVSAMVLVMFANAGRDYYATIRSPTRVNWPCVGCVRVLWLCCVCVGVRSCVSKLPP